MPDSISPSPPWPQPGPLPILWLDDDIVVVHKPAGWLVHRTGLDAHETRFVMQTLRDQLGQHVYPVHRLDKGTSGVLLMALHSGAARIASAAFEAHQVHKRYIALVRGWPPELAWEVDHPLKLDDAPSDALPQAAHTSFRLLATLQLDVPVDRYPTTRAALVEAHPRTGRRHQIRRHLKHTSHPIIGDATHGKGPHNRWWAGHLGQQRLWLHALSLQIAHPRTGEAMCFHSQIKAPFNQDWARLLAEQPWCSAHPDHCSVDDVGGVSASLVNNSAASTGSK